MMPNWDEIGICLGRGCICRKGWRNGYEIKKEKKKKKVMVGTMSMMLKVIEIVGSGVIMRWIQMRRPAHVHLVGYVFDGRHKDERACAKLVAMGLDPEGRIKPAQVIRQLKVLGLWQQRKEGGIWKAKHGLSSASSDDDESANSGSATDNHDSDRDTGEREVEPVRKKPGRTSARSMGSTPAEKVRWGVFTEAVDEKLKKAFESYGFKKTAISKIAKELGESEETGRRFRVADVRARLIELGIYDKKQEGKMKRKPSMMRLFEQAGLSMDESEGIVSEEDAVARRRRREDQLADKEMKEVDIDDLDEKVITKRVRKLVRERDALDGEAAVRLVHSKVNACLKQWSGGKGGATEPNDHKDEGTADQGREREVYDYSIVLTRANESGFFEHRDVKRLLCALCFRKPVSGHVNWRIPGGHGTAWLVRVQTLLSDLIANVKNLSPPSSSGSEGDGGDRNPKAAGSSSEEGTEHIAKAMGSKGNKQVHRARRKEKRSQQDTEVQKTKKERGKRTKRGKDAENDDVSGNLHKGRKRLRKDQGKAAERSEDLDYDALKSVVGVSDDEDEPLSVMKKGRQSKAEQSRHSVKTGSTEQPVWMRVDDDGTPEKPSIRGERSSPHIRGDSSEASEGSRRVERRIVRNTPKKRQAEEADAELTPVGKKQRSRVLLTRPSPHEDDREDDDELLSLSRRAKRMSRVGLRGVTSAGESDSGDDSEDDIPLSAALTKGKRRRGKDSEQELNPLRTDASRGGHETGNKSDAARDSAEGNSAAAGTSYDDRMDVPDPQQQMQIAQEMEQEELIVPSGGGDAAIGDRQFTSLPSAKEKEAQDRPALANDNPTPDGEGMRDEASVAEKSGADVDDGNNNESKVDMPFPQRARAEVDVEFLSEGMDDDDEEDSHP
ncbi:hypothetical protein CBR_g32345 [Chara braunii]|uniref:Uncharacterized protein n=1 Tax=Chara braunii TaxID=69332 RepID=A0A388JNK6_CHABU|nr:hypothetical protein CBR_g32345 [Chara braunii]|eukprot:GBG59333.1 hypothetical protein CBR_g32345 [Chara braunii]